MRVVVVLCRVRAIEGTESRKKDASLLSFIIYNTQRNVLRVYACACVRAR